MKEHFKKKFQISDSGAEGLLRAIYATFLVYIISMLPVMLLMYLGDQWILKHVHNHWIYFSSALAILILLYIVLWVEYERLFNATYKESANLRIHLAEQLKSLPLSYFSKKNLSDLAQSIMSDVDAIEHALSHAIPKVYGLYFFLPIIGIILLVNNVLLGLAVILPNLLRLFILYFYKDKTKDANSKYYHILRDNSEKFQEIIEMHQEIKGFNLSNKVRSELYEQMEYSEKEHLKAEGVAMKVVGISSLFSYISLGIVLLVGTHLLLAGEINILYVIGYLLAAIKIKELVDLSHETILEIFYIDPRVKRIQEINEQQLQKGNPVTLHSYDVELKHVGFSYDEDVPVLEDVSFVAKQGKVTALVGSSGCGKTTLLKLISRLYDYQRGEILIDQQDIQKIATESLFDKISIVFQDVTLFNTSLLENIRIGNESASDEEVKEAARLANCLEFIEKLPQGFDTLIGENGSELSGGERQRLSIARAFLKDAPILILDEISANLDVENERYIQKSLNKLIKNKTVIVISHRLKSIENVDEIVVLAQGRVESVGTHEELLKKSQVYSNLYEKMHKAENFVY